MRFFTYAVENRKSPGAFCQLGRGSAEIPPPPACSRSFHGASSLTPSRSPSCVPPAQITYGSTHGHATRGRSTPFSL